MLLVFSGKKTNAVGSIGYLPTVYACTSAMKKVKPAKVRTTNAAARADTPLSPTSTNRKKPRRRRPISGRKQMTTNEVDMPIEEIEYEDTPVNAIQNPASPSDVTQTTCQQEPFNRLCYIW